MNNIAILIDDDSYVPGTLVKASIPRAAISVFSNHHCFSIESQRVITIIEIMMNNSPFFVNRVSLDHSGSIIHIPFGGRVTFLNG
jgi:hypothetical protein